MSQFKHIKGGKELDAFLKTLPAKVERNIMRSALRQGAAVLRDAARNAVPVDSGDLKRSLKVSTRARRGRITAKVETKLFYARFVEYGTAAHAIVGKKGGFLSFGGIARKSVKHPGARPRPFMRPALDSHSDEAVAAVAAQIRKRLTKHGINAAPPEAEE